MVFKKKKTCTKHEWKSKYDHRINKKINDKIFALYAEGKDKDCFIVFFCSLKNKFNKNESFWST